MSRPSELPAELRSLLDGYGIVRSVGRNCPGCEQSFERGDRLTVTVSRSSTSSRWGEPSIVCSECGTERLPEAKTDADTDTDTERLLVAIELVATPQALVLDGDSAVVLDRSP